MRFLSLLGRPRSPHLSVVALRVCCAIHPLPSSDPLTHCSQGKVAADLSPPISGFYWYHRSAHLSTQKGGFSYKLHADGQVIFSVLLKLRQHFLRQRQSFEWIFTNIHIYVYYMFNDSDGVYSESWSTGYSHIYKHMCVNVSVAHIMNGKLFSCFILK